MAQVRPVIWRARLPAPAEDAKPAPFAWSLLSPTGCWNGGQPETKRRWAPSACVLGIEDQMRRDPLGTGRLEARRVHGRFVTSTCTDGLGH